MYEPGQSGPGTETRQPQLPVQPPPPPPGKGMVKVTGILMIVFGSIALLIIVPSLLVGLGDTIKDYGFGHAALQFLELAIAGCTLAFGIFGVSNAGNAAKAQNVIIMGITLCAFHVIDMTALSIMTKIDAFTVLSMIVGLVLPILYIVGGFRSKNSLKA